MTGIGRLYTQDFKKLKRDGNLALIISIIFLIISLIALFITIYG